ncbi:S-adenosyl-L-methionine-dependent methyltransferase [Ilyonectria destructans]|nr:S-adenosyl-L-methionine-dependent methyltransferase [Ilyonectria destructans]
MSAPSSPHRTPQDVGAVEGHSGGVISEQNPENLEPVALSGASSTAPSSHIEPDVWTDDDEAYAESSNTSYLSSIASDVRRGITENGRTYGVYGIHKSWIPSDDLEMERNDLQHCKFTMLMNDELYLAPMPDFPQKILDLGTGSGIWAMDIADQYPSAKVIGVDKAPVQPTMIPNNLTFELDDVEDDWLWGESSFDFIHGRELIMAIQDWPRLIRQAHVHLKPGAYLQLGGSIPDFRSDDGTLPHDSAYMEMGRIYLEMSERVSLSGWEPTKWKRYLKEAGFEDVEERILKIPTNPWPRDPYLKKIGAFELHHFRESIANVFARGYKQILGGDPTYFQVLLAKARREVSNPNMHSWVPFYVVYGRRPRSSSTSIPTQNEKSPSPP